MSTSLTPPEQPKPIPFADKVFYAELALFGGGFSTGLFMIFESAHTVASSALTIGCALGIGISLIDHFSTEARARNRFVLTLIAAISVWSLLAYDIYQRPSPIKATTTPSALATSIGGTQPVASNAQGIEVRVALDMPYTAFCTADWNAQCFPSVRNDRSMQLTFNTPAPPDGGKVEWHATPTPPLDAYRDEVQTVAERDRTIKDLKQQALDAQRQRDKTIATTLDQITNELPPAAVAYADAQKRLQQAMQDKQTDDAAMKLLQAVQVVPSTVEAEKKRDQFHQLSSRQHDDQDRIEQAQRDLSGAFRPVFEHLDSLRSKANVN